ncbi:hypothetical protein [Paenarthrobacter nitroguajacolicus]|uniref:hypothetical protein n=1 Tax=Paenarthrobacter nitroguajacolicus TaxID=211146 RepID=UPI00248AC69B|nr:hypothetical protein [Paenarthrobacter nitroguajacolicus]MDI2037287.1 hypothetical protein [Paenarthrobacter nitroguajacolicus]
MTEPNELPMPEPDAGVQWPDAAVPTADALVDGALGVLDSVPDAPLEEHGGLYTRIHDSLLEALDSEPGLPTIQPSTHRPEGNS